MIQRAGWEARTRLLAEPLSPCGSQPVLTNLRSHFASPNGSIEPTPEYGGCSTRVSEQVALSIRHPFCNKNRDRRRAHAGTMSHFSDFRTSRELERKWSHAAQIQFWLFDFLRYPRRACTVNSPALTLTKWDYFLAAFAAIRARNCFSF